MIEREQKESKEEVEAVANTFTLLNVPLYSWCLLSPSSPRI